MSIKPFLVTLAVSVCFAACGRPDLSEREFHKPDWVWKNFVEFRDEFGPAKDVGSGFYVYHYTIGGETYSVSVLDD